MNDEISAAMRQCRRLIIILSAHTKTEYSPSSCEKQNQLLYEHKVGLHDALIKNDPKVILVETGKKKLKESTCKPAELCHICFFAVKSEKSQVTCL